MEVLNYRKIDLPSKLVLVTPIKIKTLDKAYT